MESSPTPRDPDSWWWIFDPRQSLRARAALLFGGLSLAFTLLLGRSAATVLRRDVSQQLEANYEAFALQISDKLDRALDERLRMLQLAAGLAPLRSLATPVAERRALLESLLDAAPDCAWVGFADRGGRVVSATQQIFEGAVVDRSAWFLGGRREPYIGNVHETPELTLGLPNQPAERPRFLDLAVPVRDPGGIVIGVLGAQLRWTWVRDAQNSVVPEVARRQHLGATIYAATGDVLLDSGGTGWTLPPDAPAVGNRPGSHGFISEIVAGDSEYLTGYARSRNHRETRGPNWLVVVRQPVADAFAPVRELQRWIVRFGALFVVVSVAVSWIIAGRIARRLAAVAAAAERIRSGDVLSLMPRSHGRGEVQTMCTALTEMVDDFRRKQEQLETGRISPGRRDEQNS